MRFLRTLGAALATLAALAMSGWSQTQYNVTGNLGGISTVSSGTLLQARFSLVNCGTAQPTVPGVSVTVDKTKVFTADSNGNIAGTLWGNDQVSCGLGFSTAYQVAYLRNGVPVTTSAQPIYRITTSALVGGVWNLTTAVPVQSLPPINALAQGVFCPDGYAFSGLYDNWLPKCTALTVGVSTANGTNGNFVVGAMFTAQSTNGVLNPALFPGSDYGQQVNNAIAACGVRFMPTPFVSSSCTIEITPPAQSADPLIVSTSIVPPGLSDASVFITCKGGILYYTGTGYLFDLNGSINQLHTHISNCMMIGTSAAAGGVRIGSGEGMYVENNWIQGFSGTNAAGVLLNGSDDDYVEENRFFNNYDSVRMINSTVTGFPGNANHVNRNHFTGDFHIPLNATRIGAGNEFIGNIFDPPNPSALVIGPWLGDGGSGNVYSGGYVEGSVSAETYYGLESHGFGGSITNVYFGLTGAHATMMLMGGSASAVANNYVGGSEPYFITSPAGFNYYLEANTIGGNTLFDPVNFPANFSPLLINQATGVSNTVGANASIGTESNGRGLVIPKMVAPSSSGIQFRCLAGAPSGSYAQIWTDAGFGNSPLAGVDCSGYFHGPSGAAGMNGTFTAGTKTCTVSGGIVTGCA